jgi:ADP-ribose pyrophosphatase YjhB (NUDIX family)
MYGHTPKDKMSITTTSTGFGASPDAVAGIPAGQTVVAVIIEWRGKIALFRRSRRLNHDSGLWHCITGFVEAGMTPQQQALEELAEETGLQAMDLQDLQHGPALTVADESGSPWLVHTFIAVTNRRRLKLDWEHDSYRWTTASKTRRFANRVTWLDNVLTATGHIPASPNV